jgi:hypothetical protein
MNLETVLMCAQATAAKQLAALGGVDPEVQALIDELTAPVAEEAPAPKTRKPRAPAVAEEAPAEAVVEAPAAE